MPWTRRQFVTVSSLGLVGAFGQRSLFAQGRGPQPPVVPAFADVRRNVSVFTARGGTMGCSCRPTPSWWSTASSPIPRSSSSTA